jgi:aminopeptidase-like protein
MKKYYNLGKKKLFPICRSITGLGVRKTLKIIKNQFPKLKIKKIKSGTKVFDWKIPPEWNIKDAYILDKYNNKIIDFKKNNLHLVGYSIPIRKYLDKNELYKNLYFLKKQPEAIPYITSYYKKHWGFCLNYNQKKKLDKNYSKQDIFKVIINSKFNKKGFLNYGELVLKGSSSKEILISTYICHPSMANNELSGIIVSMGLINHFRKKKLSKTIRFLFIPETIGSIAYIYKNLKNMKKNIIGGYNLSCIGDDRKHSCMLSKYKNSPSDFALLNAYKKLKIKKYKIYSFLKRGSDERQYNSPGVDIPISSIFRSKYGTYPEYHTSLDNFNLVTLKGIKGGFQVAKTAINYLLSETIPKTQVLCEPHMSRYKLYPTLSIKKSRYKSRQYMDFLQYADGRNTLKKISEYIGLSFSKTRKIYRLLKSKNLIT